MDAWIQAIRQSALLITELGALIVAALAVYKNIRAELRRDGKDALRKKIIEAIATAKIAPMMLYHTLVNKPDMDKDEMLTLRGANALIAATVTERNCKLVKKAGLKTTESLITMVNETRDLVSPLL